MSKDKVTIIGGGLMGAGIAQIFALSGHPVTVYGRLGGSIEKVREIIKSDCELWVNYGVTTQEKAAAAQELVSISHDMAEAVKDADFVVEAIAEKLELKQDTFRDIDSIAKPSAVLASSTSVISITEIAAKSKGRHRILGTHFWNPPGLIPLVEVVQTVHSDPRAIEYTMNILTQAGKKALHVKKDVPGFLANRMQHALWREAVSIVEQGIADAATVDESIRTSFGLRLPILAPMENADMVGLDLTLNIHEYILKHLEASPNPSPLLKEKVAAGDLGFKSGKGFQSWTPEAIAASRSRLKQYLLEAAGKKRKDG